MTTKVEIRTSTIPNAGIGVFAKKDIKQGERICYYDGIDIERTKMNICETDMSYAINKDKKNMYIRLGNKNKTTEYNVGQFCNDSSCPNFTIIAYPSIKQAFDDYKKQTIEKINVVRENYDDFHMVANRDIKKNEELFYSYGDKYWMLHFLKNSTDSFVRLIMYHMLNPILIDTINDSEALHIFENVMNQDINNCFWENVFKDNSPKSYLIRIMKQLEII